MTRFFKLGIVFFSAFALLVLTSQSLALEQDPEDILELSTPTANSTVRGSVEIKFKVFDDDSPVVDTQLRVLDGNCISPQRTILNSSLPSSLNDQLRNWNTEAGYSDGGVLGDGEYCLQICGQFSNGSTSYSACNQRRVQIGNFSNQNPVITSFPAQEITAGENYSYLIQADDPDDDPLTISALQLPGFLSLNGNTISGPTVGQSGTFQIVVEARDPFGGRDTQSFNLRVNAPANNSDGSPGQGSVTPPPASDPEVVLQFIYPQAGATLVGRENKIEWSLQGAAAVESLRLEFIPLGELDSDNWRFLTDIPADRVADQREVNWDVSDQPQGDYRLRLTANLGVGDPIRLLSEVFSISGEDSSPGETVTDLLEISELQPFNGESITENLPQISALITNTEGVPFEIADYSLGLNDSDITSQCSLVQVDDRPDQIRLSCQLNEDLDLGNYTLSLEITEIESEQTQLLDPIARDWRFTIASPSDATESESPLGELDLNGPVGLVILLVICLLLLPLLLLLIWRRRTANRKYRKVTQTKTVTKTKTAPPPVAPLPPPAPVVKTEPKVNTLSTSESSPPNGTAKSGFSLPKLPGIGGGAAKSQSQSKSTSTTNFGGSGDPQPIPQQSSITTSGPVIGDSFSINESTTASTSPTAKPEAKDVQSSGNWLTRQRERISSTVSNLPKPSLPKPSSTKTETKTTTTAKSTAEIMGAETPPPPVAPPAPVAATPAPVSTPVQKDQSVQVDQSVEKVTNQGLTNKDAGNSGDDIPDWLKVDVDSASQATTPKGEDLKVDIDDSDSDDDGSDPYGFGDYSLGSPQK